MHPNDQLKKLKESLTKHLAELKPVFEAAQKGDFSHDIKLHDNEDEFTELFTGVRAMFNLIRRQLADVQALNQKLETNLTELKAAMERQVQNDKQKNRFIAVLSHELRNPLAPIVSTLEWLESQSQRAESVKMIKNAEYQASMMKKLLDDLLDIARVTQDKFMLNKATVDLISVVEHSMHAAGPFIKAHGHSLISHLPSEPVWVLADDFRLTQAFSNILYNAAKYTPSGGLIEITCDINDQTVLLHIKDNGVGIPKHMLERIFEPFIQVNPVPQVGSGLGIGLTLTKKLIELHNGSIKAESEGVNRGSTFCVALPLASIKNLPVSDNKNETSDVKPLRILLVDDNEAAANSLGTLLKYRGHKVDLAYNGETAISKVSNFQPHVVLLDIGLPDKNGYQVLEEFKRKRITSLFVALTGFGQEEDKVKAKQAGFHHHLTKPIGYPELENIFKQAAEIG